MFVYKGMGGKGERPQTPPTAYHSPPTCLLFFTSQLDLTIGNGIYRRRRRRSQSAHRSTASSFSSHFSRLFSSFFPRSVYPTRPRASEFSQREERSRLCVSFFFFVCLVGTRDLSSFNFSLVLLLWSLCVGLLLLSFLLN